MIGEEYKFIRNGNLPESARIYQTYFVTYYFRSFDTPVDIYGIFTFK